ncbi:MAG: hypothetical protein ACXWDO_08060, partial [Bacteroidia bacterium]
MKTLQYIVLSLFIGMAGKSYAQTGLHIGIDGAFNGTFIINQNIYDLKTGELDYAPTFGYTLGGAAGYNFNNHIGVQA